MAEAIDLAVEPPFALGPLRVVPPLRTVEHPDGAREVLEPRVIQVLVALHGAGGAIVSRHELAERCWAGRIVGEDALNRVLSRLRRVTEGIGKDAFRIETVTKVGYRLVVPGEPAPDCRPLAAGPGIETAPLWARRRLPPGKWLAGAGFALATAAASGADRRGARHFAGCFLEPSANLIRPAPFVVADPRAQLTRLRDRRLVAARAFRCREAGWAPRDTFRRACEVSLSPNRDSKLQPGLARLVWRAAVQVAPSPAAYRAVLDTT